jgi:hypothetical protein
MLKYILIYSILLSNLLGYDYRKASGSTTDLGPINSKIKLNKDNIATNKTLLDTTVLSVTSNDNKISNIETKLLDLNNSKHSHENQSILDSIKNLSDLSLTDNNLVFKGEDSNTKTLVIPHTQFNWDNSNRELNITKVNGDTIGIDLKNATSTVLSNEFPPVYDNTTKQIKFTWSDSNTSFIDVTDLFDNKYITKIEKTDEDKTLNITKKDNSVINLDLKPWFIELLDIWKDESNADYTTKGIISFEQLDNTYTRIDDFKLHSFKSLIRDSIHTEGKILYANGKLSINASTIMKLPTGSVWNIDSLYDLPIGNNKVVYFNTSRSEILQGLTKSIPQTALEVADISTFIPTESNIQVGYTSNNEFYLTSGQGSDYSNDTMDYIIAVASTTDSTLPTGITKNDKVFAINTNDIYISNGDGSYALLDKSLFNDYATLQVKDTNSSYHFNKDSGIFVEDVNYLLTEQVFVKTSNGTGVDAVVEFTATRNMYVMVTYNATGWRSSTQWGWVNTKYSGATLLNEMKGKCLLYMNTNIHQSLLPDNGYFFVKAGDTAKFWLEKTNTINIDNLDRSNITVVEIVR